MQGQALLVEHRGASESRGGMGAPSALLTQDPTVPGQMAPVGDDSESPTVRSRMCSYSQTEKNVWTSAISQPMKPQECYVTSGWETLSGQGFSGLDFLRPRLSLQPFVAQCLLMHKCIEAPCVPQFFPNAVLSSPFSVGWKKGSHLVWSIRQLGKVLCRRGAGRSQMRRHHLWLDLEICCIGKIGSISLL